MSPITKPAPLIHPETSTGQTVAYKLKNDQTLDRLSKPDALQSATTGGSDRQEKSTSAVFAKAEAAPSIRRPRYAAIDAMRGIAACIIVAHHLTLYAPQSALADELASSITGPLFSYGAYVVQIFLVIGGFTLALNMPDVAIGWKSAMDSVINRYLRLSIPYVVALGLLICAWWAMGSTMKHPLLDSPSFGQFLAHLFYLQDILGYGNLSAGTWYLCIDIQYAVFCSLLWAVLSNCIKRLKLTVKVSEAGPYVLLLLGLASAWSWNREPSNDHFVHYFLGTLVLGSLVGSSTQGHISKLVVATYSILFLASLSIDFRPRLLVAAATACYLYLSVGALKQAQLPRFLLWLGKISYCLFLIHYSISAATLNLLDTWINGSPTRACLAMLVAFTTSLFGAWLLHRYIEMPGQKWVKNNLHRGRLSSPDPDDGIIQSTSARSYVTLPT